uniref:PhoLip_ATPase_C domain-containing protein n=1 Tax=Heterorhabditis bacteriophora TaxID=37862 RepID=A0A1I7WC50_HETBA
MDLLNIGANGVRLVSDLLDEHLTRVNRAGEIIDEAAFGLVLNASCLEYCLDPHNEERFVKLLQRYVRSFIVIFDICELLIGFYCRKFNAVYVKSDLMLLSKRPMLSCYSSSKSITGMLHSIFLKFNSYKCCIYKYKVFDCICLLPKLTFKGADVGVGLSGQEGMQAVMASDFAMARFRFLSNLLLVHGHWCYHRLAQTILYFFYKNAMFVFAIYWYQIYSGFSSQVPIDPIYLMVYNLLFTSVPPLLYGCLEQDASTDILLEFPKFYDQGRLGKKYRWYSFWLNMLDAAWQSAVIYWLCHFTFIDTDCDLWTFGVVMCTQLLVVNTFHLALLVQYWTWPMFWSMFLSLTVFFAFSLLYNGFVTAYWTWTNVKDTPVLIAEYAMADARFWLIVLLSTVLCLIPRFVLIVITNSIRPSGVLSRKQLANQADKPRCSTISLNCIRVTENM